MTNEKRNHVLCAANILADDGRLYAVQTGKKGIDGEGVYWCTGYNSEGKKDNTYTAILKGSKVLYNGWDSAQAYQEQNKAVYGTENPTLKTLKELGDLVYYHPLNEEEGEIEGLDFTSAELAKRNDLNETRAKYRAEIKTLEEKLEAWQAFQWLTKKDGKPFAVVSNNYDKKVLSFGDYGSGFFRYGTDVRGHGKYDEFHCKGSTSPQTFEALQEMKERRIAQLSEQLADAKIQLASIEDEYITAFAMYRQFAEFMKNANCKYVLQDLLYSRLGNSEAPRRM